MKKLFLLFAIVFSLLAIVSCKDDDQDTPKPSSTSISTTITELRSFIGASPSEVANKLKAKGSLKEQTLLESDKEKTIVYTEVSMNPSTFHVMVNKLTNKVYSVSYIKQGLSGKTDLLNKYTSWSNECVDITKNKTFNYYSSIDTDNSNNTFYYYYNEFKDAYNTSKSNAIYINQDWSFDNESIDITFTSAEDMFYNINAVCEDSDLKP